MNYLRMILFVSLIIAGCTDGSSDSGKNGSDHKAWPEQMHSGSDVYSLFIPVDSANKMLESYLQSINYSENDSSLRSVVFSADSLRAYLGNTSIKHVKLMFAHTLDYINEGNEGETAGYNSEALTFIIACYGSGGDYIYSERGQVLEHGMPCPTNCVAEGTASSDLLTN